MSESLYLECNAGISGDMTVAMLLDLGADEKKLLRTLQTLPLSGYEIKITRVKKAGLDACDFNVVLTHELDNHDHDMEYLHGLLSQGNATESAHATEHHEMRHNGHHTDDYLEALAGRSELEAQEMLHDHDHGHEAHEHRGLNDVLTIINKSEMSDRAKKLAGKIFTILGEAEAKAHGETLETVHFHEVGALDSIVDIAAAAICLDDLSIENVIVTGLCEGTGTIRCAHGVLPVPVPAVSAIVTKYEIPLSIMQTEGEFVTPTGAAIAAATRTGAKLPEKFTVKKIGLGAGKRQYERPSLLRGMLIHECKDDSVKPAAVIETGRNAFLSRDAIVKLETDLDDCTGEALGYLMQELLKAGANDVHYQPVYMKKDRPGYELTVLCKEEQRQAVENLIFLNTTTIDIRRCVMDRTVLPRKIRTVLTPYGDVHVKEVTLPSGEVRSYPEYEDIATICRAYGLGYTQVYEAVVWAADESNE